MRVSPSFSLDSLGWLESSYVSSVSNVKGTGSSEDARLTRVPLEKLTPGVVIPLIYDTREGPNVARSFRQSPLLKRENASRLQEIFQNRNVLPSAPRSLKAAAPNAHVCPGDASLNDFAGINCCGNGVKVLCRICGISSILPAILSCWPQPWCLSWRLFGNGGGERLSRPIRFRPFLLVLKRAPAHRRTNVKPCWQELMKALCIGGRFVRTREMKW